MKQPVTRITEDEVVEYLLALHESGASAAEMRAYLRSTQTEALGEPYLKLFQSFSDERERMAAPEADAKMLLSQMATPRIVTKRAVDRSFQGGERTRFSLSEVITYLTRMVSWKYAAPGLAMVGVLALSVWIFGGNEQRKVALEDQPLTKTTPSGAVSQKPTGNEGSAPALESVSPVPTAPKQGSVETTSDVESLALALLGSEGTESFTDEDQVLDVSADESLLDNDQMYDETLF